MAGWLGVGLSILLLFIVYKIDCDYYSPSNDHIENNTVFFWNTHSSELHGSCAIQLGSIGYPASSCWVPALDVGPKK
jgi:hypothetical protein